jgi:hypothetical protein
VNNRNGETRVRQQASVVLALVDAVRVSRQGGWTRDEFLKFCAEVYAGVEQQEARLRAAREGG